MMAFSCNSNDGTIKAAYIIKLSGIMVLLTHDIDYMNKAWSRKIAYDGDELIYEGIWNYETIEKSDAPATLN